MRKIQVHIESEVCGSPAAEYRLEVGKARCQVAVQVFKLQSNVKGNANTKTGAHRTNNKTLRVSLWQEEE